MNNCKQFRLALASVPLIILLTCATTFAAETKLTPATASMQANQIIKELNTQRFTPALETKARNIITQLKAAGFTKLADNVRGVLAIKTPPPLPPRTEPTAEITALKNQIGDLKNQVDSLKTALNEVEEYYLKAGHQAIAAVTEEKEEEINELKKALEDTQKKLEKLHIKRLADEIIKKRAKEKVG